MSDFSSTNPQPPRCAVLLVDDNLTIHKITSAVLGKMGVLCTHAHNGQDAIRLLKSGQVFDAILMDMFMPILCGIEATKLIRHWERANKITPNFIIGHSGTAYSETIQEGLIAGMDTFLPKPFDKDAFLRLLADHNIVF